MTKESISNNELTSELEHFRSTIDSKSVEAYIVDGNSDYNYVVEETQSSLTDFSHLSFDISIVDAEEGTEGSICLDRSDGELYDFRPSRETIEQHQERGPI